MSRTLADELRAGAVDGPDHPCLRGPEGEWSYAATARRVDALADALTEAGVRRRAVVALLLESSLEQVALWLALATLDAVHAPLNTALVGDLLQHALTVSGAELLVVDPAHHDVAVAVTARMPRPPRVVLLAELGAAADRAGGGGRAASGLVEPDPLATATLLFTSGTTGPSKACALSHRYLLRQAELHAREIEAGPDDVLFTPFPLFHIDGVTLTVGAALCARATAAIVPRFSVSRYWDQVREHRATVFNYMGATLSLLWKAPPTERDRDHRVRLAWGVPLPDWHEGFAERFGLAVRAVYGLTDAGVPVYEPLRGPRVDGTTGRVLPEYDLRLDLGRARPGDRGGVGEILVRGHEPGLVMNEYFGDPTASAATLHDGWVRTGDLGELVAEHGEQWLIFHGRLSDSVRRRGENVACFEVEAMLLRHPEVVEAAVVGYPSPLTEEDVRAFVRLVPGSTLTMAALHAHALAHGPRHHAPRYLETVAGMPRTPTEKVEKYRLRDRPLGPGTFDAEATRAAPAQGGDAALGPGS